MSGGSGGIGIGGVSFSGSLRAFLLVAGAFFRFLGSPAFPSAHHRKTTYLYTSIKHMVGGKCGLYKNLQNLPPLY